MKEGHARRYNSMVVKWEVSRKRNAGRGFQLLDAEVSLFPGTVAGRVGFD